MLCRTPLKKGDMPKLVAKALIFLEAAGAMNEMDILPDSVRQEHSLMPWLQVGCMHLWLLIAHWYHPVCMTPALSITLLPAKFTE